MAAQDNLQYIWASEIIREYERAALKAGIKLQNRDIMMVQWKSPLQVMEMALDSAEAAMIVSPTSIGEDSEENSNLESVESSLTQANEKKQITNRMDPWKASASAEGVTVGSCDKGADDWWQDFQDPNTKSQGLQVVWGGAHVSAKWDPIGQLIKSIGHLLPEETLRKLSNPEAYTKDCWNCLLTLRFNWQIQPINFLAEIDKLLRDIEELLDWIQQRSNPNYIYQWLCNFDWVFTLLCPMNWVALMAMLISLLQKYQMDAFSLSLDWTAIVGPIIKAVFDSIASLLEAIVALIKQPLDCLIGVLRTIDAIIDKAQELVNESNAFYRYLVSTRNPLVQFAHTVREGEQDKSPGAFNFSVESQKSMKEFPSEAFKNILPQWSPSFRNLETPKPAKTNISAQKPTDLTTGYKVGGSSTLSDEVKNGVFKNPNFTGLDALILGLQELEQWITELSDNIILGLKSIGKMFGGSLALSVQKTGIIMLVLDLIALIRALIKLAREGCSKGEPDSISLALSNLSAEDIARIIDENRSPKDDERLIREGIGNVEIQMEAPLWKSATTVRIDRCSPQIPEEMVKIFEKVRNI